jgi:hypothetical protein
MKLHELISGLKIILTNEEKKFLNKFNTMKLSNLNERDLWMAQNLVRKGLYTVDKDNNTLKKL